ncbi:MAG: helix-turn-helix transcriptional regulator [Bacilli bacterium]|jgi:transcriptional regulator with XRE-family HTH domain
MLFKEAISQRILELCDKYGYTPNKLAEISAIAPSTLRATLSNTVDNPSSYIIYKICKTLKIELKEFYDSDLFNINKIED